MKKIPKELDQNVLDRIYEMKLRLQDKHRQPNHNQKLSIGIYGDTSIAVLTSSHIALHGDYFGVRDILLEIAALTTKETKSKAIKCYQLLEDLMRMFKNTIPELEDNENAQDSIASYMGTRRELIGLTRMLSREDLAATIEFMEAKVKIEYEKQEGGNNG
jgi:hypothetical protein